MVVSGTQTQIDLLRARQARDIEAIQRIGGGTDSSGRTALGFQRDFDEASAQLRELGSQLQVERGLISEQQRQQFLSSGAGQQLGRGGSQGFLATQQARNLSQAPQRPATASEELARLRAEQFAQERSRPLASRLGGYARPPTAREISLARPTPSGFRQTGGRTEQLVDAREAIIGGSEKFTTRVATAGEGVSVQSGGGFSNRTVLAKEAQQLPDVNQPFPSPIVSQREQAEAQTGADFSFLRPKQSVGESIFLPQQQSSEPEVPDNLLGSSLLGRNFNPFPPTTNNPRGSSCGLPTASTNRNT